MTERTPGPRRGRPPGTSARELEVIALRLFTERGFHETTVDDIAAAAGVSRRTFFRYYDAKSDVLWNEFDTEVATITQLLVEASGELPVMDAVREAVLAANHYRAEDVPELRMRMNLLSSVPELAASAARHYDAWERAVSAYVGARTGHPPDALYPLAAGRAVLAACRAAYDRWSARADADLTVYLDAALRFLAGGFTEPAGVAEPPASSADLASIAKPTTDFATPTDATKPPAGLADPACTAKPTTDPATPADATKPPASPADPARAERPANSARPARTVKPAKKLAKPTEPSTSRLEAVRATEPQPSAGD
ncbi:mycofactocin system transcriptional regulator [Amycolatopsis sp. cmx-4-68]|uniref:mycofactocin system transcriptional regulator n=1 Tax=Amycolatopsis sp. cmx-4-68 TaxID=2790938 RepID=UPI003979DBD5